MFYVVIAATLLVGYLIGSIPTGYLIVKKKKGIDIRTIGSGSTGATNVSRVLGKKWFFIVMVLDMLKGFLPVFAVSYLWGNEWNVVAMVVGLVVGHSRTCFLKGKGGKSVAIGLGILFALNWMAGLIVFLVWALIVQVGKYVSVGSIAAFVMAPVLLWLCGAPMSYVWCGVFMGVYIVIRHRENIRRLLNHQENRFSWTNQKEK